MAAAVRVVVRRWARSRRTSPTPGTFTSVEPPAVSVTRLPRTVTAPRTFAEAAGARPASQVALAVTVPTSIRDSRGRPGTCSRASTSRTEPSARRAVTVALAEATSAPRTVNGLPPATPSSRADSAVRSALRGAWTSLRETASGTSTVLSSRDTSSPVRRTTAEARPRSAVACAGPAPRTAGPAARAVTVATAARRRAGMRKSLLFKVVGPPEETGLGPVNLVRPVGERSAIQGHFTRTWICRTPLRITGHGRSLTARSGRSAPPGAVPRAPVRPPADRPRTPPGRPARPPPVRGGRARRGRPSWSRTAPRPAGCPR